MKRVRASPRQKAVIAMAFWVAYGLFLGHGCGPPAPEFFPTLTAVVKGLVLDGQNNRLPGARVLLETPNTLSTLTQSDGTYIITGVPPATYDLVASRLVGTVVQVARLRFIPLAGGQTFLAPDIVLKNPGTLAGVVTLQGSSSSAGATVTVIGTSHTGTTAANGTFTITGMEEGVYSISIAAPGFVDDTISNLAVVSGGTTNAPSITLRPSNPSPIATLAGRVLLESRTDNSGVTVLVDGTSRSEVTTSGGFFTFADLPLSTYSMTLSRTNYFTRHLGPVTVIPGQTLVTLPTTQLDSHQVMNTQMKAWGLAFNPDGSQIAYINSGTPATAEIALTDGPTAQIFQRVITSGSLATPFGGLAWSPDGNDILFTRSFAAPTNATAIGAVTSAGLGLRNLLPPSPQSLRPAWSPDGSAFVFFNNPVLRTIDVDRSTGSLVATTSTSAVIDTPGTLIRFTGNQWSLTGRIVYSFSTMPAGGLLSTGITSVFSTGGGRTAIVPRLSTGQTIASAESPAFDPSFSKIAFSFKDGTATSVPPNGIYTMDLDGTNATQITTQPGDSLNWSPDGTRIIYTSLTTDPNPSRISQVLVPR